MNKTWVLFKVQCINFFQINEIRESSSKKRKSVLIIGSGLSILLLLLFLYNIFIAQTLVHVGQQKLIPPYSVAVSSFALLFITLFYSNGLLFGSRDINRLFPLPVKSSEIMGSKFMFMYVLTFLLGSIFMIPSGIVWVLNAEISIVQALLYFVSVFFVPLIPMTLSSFIGVLIVLVSSRFKNRNSLSIIFSFIMIGLIGYIGVLSMQTDNDMNELGVVLVQQITRMYPLSVWFSVDFIFPIHIGMSSFVILSTLTYYIFTKIVSGKYELLYSLSNPTSTYTKHIGIVKKRSSFFALYRKELGRFLSSYMTVLNTGLGVIFLCVFSIILLVVPLQQFETYTGMNDIGDLLADYGAIVIASMLSLSSSTASAISLEGKNIWIIQSSPISIKKILNSKLAVNFTLHSFGYFLAVLAFIVTLDMNVTQLVTLLFVPIGYSIFVSVLGIYLNKKYPTYTWDSEMIVVKQSFPVIILGVVGIGVVLTPVALIWILSFPLIPTLWGTAFLLLVISVCLYLKAGRSNYV